MHLTIETPRLVLRLPEPHDAPAVARCVGDFDVARMTGSIPHPYPVEAAEGWIVFAAAQRRRGENYSFVIEVKGESVPGGVLSGVLGGAGVFRRRPWLDWEVGYHVAKPAWGRGIASEALAAVISWSRAELASSRLTAGYFEDNAASRRVLEKAGFAPTGETSWIYSMARGTRVKCIDLALESAISEHAA
jgi:RimJ/RimL family protein N-acetyltransferase